MSRKLNITVMLGGPGAEREVSLRSGAAVAAALRSLGHTVNELDPRTPDWILPPQTQVVFLALHGTYGEDGTVQRQLDRLGEPFPEQFLSPLVVKPSRQGSSVGLQFVESVEDWPGALAEALKFDSEVLAEEKIIGRETTVGILGGEVLPVVEVRPKAGGYDYTNKYTPGNTEYFCPAEFDAATTQRIQAAALGAFHAIGGRDYARVDVMVRADGSPVVLEVNTLPGMTETSLLPKAAAAAGMTYAELCQRMTDLALKRKTAAELKAEQEAAGSTVVMTMINVV